MSASRLVRPDIEYKPSFLTALAEYHAEGRQLYNNISRVANDFPSFIHALRAERGYPHQPFQDWVECVPETILWLVKDDEYIGTAEIRHRLNWHLEKWGGNIHFTIRPSMRDKGFGKKLLTKAKPFANYMGLENALITVAPDNGAAIKVIEFCGATFDKELDETGQFPARLRYWLDCR